MAFSAPGCCSLTNSEYPCHSACAELVAPVHTTLVRMDCTWVLKVEVAWRSTRELVANVTRPRLSRPSENFSTNPIAAAFRGLHAELLLSDPERSMMIMM